MQAKLNAARCKLNREYKLKTNSPDVTRVQSDFRYLLYLEKTLVSYTGWINKKKFSKRRLHHGGITSGELVMPHTCLLKSAKRFVENPASRLDSNKIIEKFKIPLVILPILDPSQAM